MTAVLPSPAMHDDWRTFAQALIAALADGIEGGVNTGAVQNIIASTPIPPSSLPAYPAGYSPIWLNSVDANLYLANPEYDPPNAGNIVYIDTANIAEAAIEANKIATGAITTPKVGDAVIVTAKIANAAIVTALIGEAQIVSAKIGDLAVNEAKIADLAVGSAKIANLAVNTAKIANAAIGEAQIGNLAVTTAKIGDAAITTAKIGSAQIGTAQIGLAAITSALIGDAAIVAAKIAAAAIGTAHIQDAAISSAKIASLVINKVTAGTMNAVIDMGTGLIRFTIAGNTLVLGKGFGTASQFIMWFGPSKAENLMNETDAVFYLKTNGSAYFGGALSAGIIHNTTRTTVNTATATATIGPFTSNGNPITIIADHSYLHTQSVDAGTGSITGSGSATIILESSLDGGATWNQRASFTSNETEREVIVDGDPSVKDLVRWGLGGSTTTVWTPGALSGLMVRTRISSRTLATLGGNNPTSVSISQTTGCQTKE